MFRKILLTAVLVSALAVFAVPVGANDAIDNALTWLRSEQQLDGGFGTGFNEGSDLGATCDVVLAMAAAGEDPSQWISSAGNSPLDYLYSQVAAGEPDAISLAAKITLVLEATGQDPTDFTGRDLIQELDSGYDEETGSFGSNVFDQALVILALHNAGEEIPQAAVEFLLELQTEDGAWALFGSTDEGDGDTNTTALVIQALLAVGYEDEIGTAIAYLEQVQNDDGGFPYQVPSEYGTDTDVNSTAYVLQALLAADEPLSAWAPEGTDPVGALVALQDPDTGAFYWQAAVPSPNLVATAQAIPALAGYTFVSLPRVEIASAPEAGAPVAAALPESGGMVLLPFGFAALGAAGVGSGILLLRRRG